MSHYLNERDCVSTSRHAVFGFSRVVLQRQDFVLLPTATRRRMPGAGRSYSCRRSTSPVSLDALGARAQRRLLPRFLERCSRSCLVICLMCLQSDAPNDRPELNASSLWRKSELLICNLM